MSIIAKLPKPNLWNDICKEFEEKNLQSSGAENNGGGVVTSKSADVTTSYDPAIHHPAFVGVMHAKLTIDTDCAAEFDSSVSHPSLVGYALLEKPKQHVQTSPVKPKDDFKNTCSATEYLETYVFPHLLPCMENMLRQAKTEQCFTRKRTKFNALDSITIQLYRFNKKHEDREEINELGDIPFVKEHWVHSPRPPLPLSLILSVAEATLLIQNFWRGYKVRKDPEICELRQWQKEWRNDKQDIHAKVDSFWQKKSVSTNSRVSSFNEKIL